MQRAQAFEAAVRQLGANAVLHVFGGAKHELTGEMRSAACDFLQGAAARSSSTDASILDVLPY